MANDEVLKNPEELLKKGLTEIGFSYSQGQINAFMTYLSELKKWNRTYNLTALKTDEDIIIKHFLDSLLYLKAILKVSDKWQVTSNKLKNKNSYKENSLLVTLYSSLKICDVGSGAGFPGIPLKIVCPEIEITLIEPSRKKCAFLRHILRTLRLERIAVLECRLEELGKDYEKTYDIILSRATFKIKEFLKKACPYLKEGGRLVLSKGPRVLLEEMKGVDAVEKVFTPELPFIKAQRNLIVLKCFKNLW